MSYKGKIFLVQPQVKQIYTGQRKNKLRLEKNPDWKTNTQNHTLPDKCFTSSTIKVQTLGAISESFNETTHCTADGPTRYIPVDRAQFLADWRHQQVAFKATLDCTASPRCTGQLVAKAEMRAAEVSGVGGRGSGRKLGQGPWWYLHACSHS